MEPIEALKRGEEEAIHWLVDSFSQRLLKAATLMLGDRYLAEDAVQDCFLDAISHLSSFRGEASIYTWLYTILLRRCSRQKKRSLREVVQSSEVVEGVLSRQGRDTGEPGMGEPKLLREAIKSLRYKYREIIVLFYYEEFTIKEIAELLHEPEGTVKSRLHRARRKLKNVLEQEEALCL